MRALIIHKVHNSLVDILIENNIHVDEKLNLSREELIAILPDYNCLIVRSALKVDKEIIDAGKNLKIIARLGAGIENIDKEYAEEKNISVVNAPEGNRAAVGEHSMAMLLSLFNKINIADSQVRKGIWNREENRGVELEGMVVGIIGYGNMGSAFAKRLSGFGTKTIAYDKYKSNYSDSYVKEVELKDIFEQADIISIHTPLQADTLYMVNEEFINYFKKNIYIINTSRGKVLKTSALVDALKSGKVKGACLDVLEYEGLSFENILENKDNNDFNYLINSEKVVLTPHIAGWTQESNKKMSIVLAQKIVYKKSSM